MFDLINNGTVNGEAIVHCVTAFGTNILININTKKNTATNGIPEKGNEVNKVTNLHEITSPKFVHSNIPINCEVKNNKTNTYPKPSKFFDKPTLYCVLFLIFPEIHRKYQHYHL